MANKPNLFTVRATFFQGWKYCLNGQQATSDDHSSNISSDKAWEKQIRGKNASGYQKSGKFDMK